MSSILADQERPRIWAGDLSQRVEYSYANGAQINFGDLTAFMHI